MMGMSEVDCRDWSVLPTVKAVTEMKFIMSLTRTLQFRVEIPKCVIRLLKLYRPNRQNIILESGKLLFCFKKLCETLSVWDPGG